MNWTAALHDPRFRNKFLLSMALLAVVLTILFFVLEFVEHRHGSRLPNSWLEMFPAPLDYSALIFSATYGAIFFGLIFCLRKPVTALIVVRGYLLLQFMRCLSLLCVPLKQPDGIIPLHDPFLEATFYNGHANMKDLFFSGHVATMLLFYFMLPKTWMKTVVLLLAVCAGILLILQRVHYAIDVGAAPAFSLAAFLLARRWTSREFS